MGHGSGSWVMGRGMGVKVEGKGLGQGYGLGSPQQVLREPRRRAPLEAAHLEQQELVVGMEAVVPPRVTVRKEQRRERRDRRPPRLIHLVVEKRWVERMLNAPRLPGIEPALRV